MKKYLLTSIAAFAVCSSAWTYAADGDKPATPDKPAPEKTTPAPRERGNPGGPGGGRFGGFAPDPLAQTISMLGDLNLSTTFTLTNDQKEKIQAIRDEYKKKQDAWRTEHEADLKKIQDQFAALRAAGQAEGNREKIQEIMQTRQALQETAPKGDEAAASIKALLTTEQLKAYDAKQAENEKNRAAIRERFGGGAGGAPGAGRRGGAGGGDGAGRRGGDAAPKPANGI